MLARSQKALLAGLIDYAGLFPPAALSMEEAVRNYARYREGEHAWMLGRFVVPEAGAREVPSEFPKSVLGVDELTFAQWKERLPGFQVSELPGEPRFPAFQVAGVPGEPGNSATRQPGEGNPATRQPGNLPKATRQPFIELTDTGLIPELAKHGLCAKIRTGGVTPEAIPHPDRVATFIHVCAMHAVPFKATAGLHHPVRCVRALTYDADSPRATMHGFINVFMAAAFPHDAERILVEEDPRAFRFEDDAAWWRDHAVTTEHLAAVRREFAISFGSCSFEEPVAELKELGWL
jgi:hypothetical protein